MNKEVTSRILAELLEARNFMGIKAALAGLTSADTADAIAEFEPAEQAALFRLLPMQSATAVFEYLPVEAQERLIHAMGNEQAAAIIDAMSPDDRTALLEELPTALCAKLINQLSPTERAIAIRLLDYPEHSVGRLMTSEYLTLREDWTAREALDHIRTHGQGSETLNVLYVVDEVGRLLDEIRIRELLLCPLETYVRDLRDNVLISLNATDDQEIAVAIFRKYHRTVIPVVDGYGGMVGIVTVDDILDVAEEEATEDIHKLGGMEQLDEPYMDISIHRLIRKRVTWLVVLFIGQMLTTTAMSHYEDAIQKAWILSIFMPLIISSGGNSGSQSASLIIRAMAIGEVTLRDWWKVMRREVYSGLILGIILAIIGLLRITVWSRFTDTYGPHWLLLAFTVSLSLLGVVMLGTLAGSMLPFLLKRLGLDPATSSSPFVATLVDVTGLIIYFTVAGYLLRGTLL
ncbi:MAG: magnesium transporter [Luteolibacter sp.]